MKPFALCMRSMLALIVASGTGCGEGLTLPGSTVTGLEVDVIAGNAQTGQVGEALPEPVIVQVRSEDGTPIRGRKVAFSAAQGGAEAFDPDTAVTNSEGEAVTRWFLGTSPGTYTAEARVVAQSDTTVLAVALQADARAGDPDTARAAGPTAQPGFPGEPLRDSLTVAVVDRFGNPVEGASVGWTIVNGPGGTLSPETSVTGPDGIASVSWTMGDRTGVQKVEAKVEGTASPPVEFTAVVLF
jgi:Bacterial Ig-like domain (group 1)